RLLLTNRQPWLRPGTVAGVLSLLLVAALFLVRWRGTNVSAAELLARGLVPRLTCGDERRGAATSERVVEGGRALALGPVRRGLPRHHGAPPFITCGAARSTRTTGSLTPGLREAPFKA